MDDYLYGSALVTSPDVKCMHPAYHEDVSAFLESFIVLQIVSVSYLYGIVWHLLGSKRPSTGNNQYVFIYICIYITRYIFILQWKQPHSVYIGGTHTMGVVWLRQQR